VRCEPMGCGCGMWDVGSLSPSISYAMLIRPKKAGC